MGGLYSGLLPTLLRDVPEIAIQVSRQCAKPGWPNPWGGERVLAVKAGLKVTRIVPLKEACASKQQHACWPAEAVPQYNFGMGPSIA